MKGRLPTAVAGDTLSAPGSEKVNTDMSLQAKIMEDLKAAMRAKDEVARDTLRMLKSELGRAELEKGASLDEGEELDVLVRAVKTRKDSMAQYAEGGRQDLVDKERAEIHVIERFLPKALDEAETRDAIASAIRDTGASSKKDLGKVMSAVMKDYRGRVDGKLVSKIAGELLS